MDIVYAATTEGATLMLDARGVCRWAIPAPGMSATTVSERLVGAQFVASLDVASEQGLASLPKVGVPMLFAAVDEAGHITLVRTGNLLRFEDKRAAGPLPARLEAPTPAAGSPLPERLEAPTPAMGSPVPLVRRWNGPARRRTPPPLPRSSTRSIDAGSVAGLPVEGGRSGAPSDPETVRRPRVR